MISGNNPVVLDTSAYSWFRRGAPELVSILQQADQVLVPSIVIGELLAGFAVGSRKRENTSILNQFLSEEFVFEVRIDRRIAEHYASIFAALRANGTPIPTNDIWIAACARANGATMLTYDNDFTRIPGLEVILLATEGPHG